MKKFVFVAVLVMVMVFVGGAMAAEDENPLSIGLTVGYFMPAENDLDNGLCYGLRLSYEVSEIASIELETNFATCDVENTTFDADVMLIHLDYVLHAEDTGSEDNLFFYGAGLTMSTIDVGSLAGQNMDSKPDKFGGNIILGYEITDQFCFEVRYSVIGDETLGGQIGTLDMGGISGMVRVRF